MVTGKRMDLEAAVLSWQCPTFHTMSRSECVCFSCLENLYSSILYPCFNFTMEKPTGSLQEQALKRKERLKALRDRQLQGQGPEDGEPASKRAPEASETEERHRELKLRNYTPEDEELKERQVPKAKPASVEDKVKDQLEAANPEPVIEEVDLANLAPRKPDWDLKRDVAKKLEKLERRTQKAIAELIRERLKGSEEELAGAVGAVGMEEGDSD
ncbi:coiled-coil domain-containing protein 12 [Pseudorasbora parva]|uniref:coiled-coil domain-containing protein 12 n=1 Tax=Pseudorasbora parva TaxID=51549 RepID=UPI00351F6F35